MAYLRSNLPERYLIHICKKCGSGVAVPTTSAEAAIWEMTGRFRPEQCRYCNGLNMVVEEEIFRTKGKIS